MGVGVSCGVTSIEEFLAFIQPPPTTKAAVSRLQDEGHTSNHLDILEMIASDRPSPLAEPLAPTIEVTAEHQAVFQVFGEQTATLEALLHSSLAKRLNSVGPFSLSTIESEYFDGDGVYSLYYQGDFPLYEPIRSLGSEYPIYVGKSAQPARRAGKSTSRHRNMHRRLAGEHLKSLRQAQLNPEHFTYRFILMERQWVDLAEYSLVNFLHPLWNNCVPGFGSRAYARDRRAEQSESLTSTWDTLHPGRLGTGKFKKDIDVVIQKVNDSIGSCLQGFRRNQGPLP